MLKIFYIQSLALINDAAKTLAVISDKKGASNNLNYIIGGLLLVVIILLANTLFNKKG